MTRRVRSGAERQFPATQLPYRTTQPESRQNGLKRHRDLLWSYSEGVTMPSRPDGDLPLPGRNGRCCSGVVVVAPGMVVVAPGMVVVAPGMVVVAPGVVVVAPGVVVVAPGMVVVAPGMVVVAPGMVVVAPGMAVVAPGMVVVAPGIAVVAPGMVRCRSGNGRCCSRNGRCCSGYGRCRSGNGRRPTYVFVPEICRGLMSRISNASARLFMFPKKPCPASGVAHF
jgi:hypothetical protein